MSTHASPCTCKVYRFPHRATGGKCLASDPGPFCGHCGEPAEAVEEDFGIGAYEYCGHRGTHRDVQVVSRCCEAPLWADASLTVEYP